MDTPVLDPITGNFKAISFCRILDKFTRRAKAIRKIGDPDNQLPDKWSSTVYVCVCVCVCVCVYMCVCTSIRNVKKRWSDFENFEYMFARLRYSPEELRKTQSPELVYTYQRSFQPLSLGYSKRKQP